MKNSLMIFIKGLFMGLADIIPGISGGTVALITGIYDRLINAINSVVNIPVEKSFRKVDFKFLIPLVLGIIVSLFLMANLILLIMDYSVALVYSLFTGLILASALTILKNQKRNLKNYSFAFLGMIAGFSTGFIGFQLPNTSPMLFFSGFIAVSAMILPGISGAFILLILGQYEYLLNVLRNITTNYFEALIFILGGITGLIFLIKIIKYFLDNYKPQTYHFITGLMLGSLYLPIITILQNPEHPLPVITMFIVGIILIIITQRNNL